MAAWQFDFSTVVAVMSLRGNVDLRLTESGNGRSEQVTTDTYRAAN